MGSSNTQPAITYKIIKRQKNTIMGLIDYIQTDLGDGLRYFTLKSKSFLEQTDFQKVWQRLIKRKQILENSLSHSIMRIHYFIEKQNKGYCSNIKKLQIFYDDIQEDLQMEYLFKKCNKVVYSESQIMKIIKDLMNGIQIAAQQRLRLCHLSKKSIFKNKNGNYCLVLHEDAESIHPINEYITNFNGGMFTKNFYLSPKELQSINQFCIIPSQNAKDHIFTLGMIILSLCLMKQFQFQSEIISVKIDQSEKQFVFEEKSIKTQIDKVRKLVSQIKYGDNIKEILLKMLEFDQQNRLSIRQFNQLQQGKKKMRVIQQIQLKKTMKKIQWHHKIRQSKENIGVIPPSLQSFDRICHKQIGQHENLVNDIKILVNNQQICQNKSFFIATQAKDYKRAKMSSLRIDHFCQKQVTSEVGSFFTPIKRLHGHQISKENQISKQLFKGIKNFVQAQSFYQCQSFKNTQQFLESKTSLAYNLQKFGQDNRILKR